MKTIYMVTAILGLILISSNSQAAPATNLNCGSRNENHPMVSVDFLSETFVLKVNKEVVSKGSISDVKHASGYFGGNQTEIEMKLDGAGNLKALVKGNLGQHVWSGLGNTEKYTFDKCRLVFPKKN